MGVNAVLWACFGLYYAIGFFVALYVVDGEEKPPKLWHVPLIALVWPALFIMGSDE